jgi:hypothetical protein
MYWDTLIVLGIYLLLQMILGILSLIFTDHPEVQGCFWDSGRE